jgi:hypothetical protein
MPFFDFSEDVWRARCEAESEALRLCAQTTVHNAEFPGAARRAGFQLNGAAPWKDRDLVVLEDLVSAVRGRTVQVTVFDIDDLSVDEIRRLFPEGRVFRDDYRDGKLIWFGEGRVRRFGSGPF